MNELQDKKRTILLDVFQKGVTKLLDEAKVPQREHLKVIAALADRVNAHKRDMQIHAEYMARHEGVVRNHERQIQDWDNTSRHLLSITHLKGEKGESIKGEPGKDGASVDTREVVSKVLALLRIPEDGKDGKDAVIDEDKIVGKLIKKLQDGKTLDLSHIKGAQTFIKDGVKYKVEELMHGAGSSAGAAGLGYLPITSGTIDNANTVFTFSKSPTIVVVNGASYINGAGVTISGITATLDNPANTGGSVYGLG